MVEQEGSRKEEQGAVESERPAALDRRKVIKAALGAGLVASVGSGWGCTAVAQTGNQPASGSTHAALARSLLKEIPLGEIEQYLQVLNSGILQNRSALAVAKGNWCGVGCDTTQGHVCGLWCAVNMPHGGVGAFDVYGHSDIPKQALQDAIADPQGFRKVLNAELRQVSSFIEDPARSKPHLAPVIDPNIFIQP